MLDAKFSSGREEEEHAINKHLEYCDADASYDTDTNFKPLALVPMGRREGESVCRVSETTPSYKLIM